MSRRLNFYSILFLGLIFSQIHGCGGCGGGGDSSDDLDQDGIEMLLGEASAALSAGDVTTAKDKYDEVYTMLSALESESKLSTSRNIRLSTLTLTAEEQTFVTNAQNQAAFGLVLTRLFLLPEHSSLAGVMAGFGQSTLASSTSVFGTGGLFKTAETQRTGSTNLTVTINGTDQNVTQTHVVSYRKNHADILLVSDSGAEIVLQIFMGGASPGIDVTPGSGTTSMILNHTKRGETFEELSACWYGGCSGASGTINFSSIPSGSNAAFSGTIDATFGGSNTATVSGTFSGTESSDISRSFLPFSSGLGGKDLVDYVFGKAVANSYTMFQFRDHIDSLKSEVSELSALADSPLTDSEFEFTVPAGLFGSLDSADILIGTNDVRYFKSFLSAFSSILDLILAYDFGAEFSDAFSSGTYDPAKLVDALNGTDGSNRFLELLDQSRASNQLTALQDGVSAVKEALTNTKSSDATARALVRTSSNQDTPLNALISMATDTSASLSSNTTITESSLSPFTFVSQVIDGPFRYSSRVEGEDLDGDGNLDLVIVKGNEVSIAWGSSSNKFESTLTRLTALSSSDSGFVMGLKLLPIFASAQKDIVIVRFGFDVTVTSYQNNGNRSFGSPTTLITLTTSGTGEVDLADLNGDGVADIAFKSSEAKAGVHLNKNDGTGTFNPITEYDTPNTPNDSIVTLRLANVRGSTDPDLILGTHNPGDDSYVSVYANDGAGAFPAVSQQLGLGGENSGFRLHPAKLSSASQQGVFYETRNGSISSRPYLNSSGTLSAGTALSNVSSITELADLDGNGTDDVIVGNEVYLNDGSAGFLNMTPLYLNSGVNLRSTSGSPGSKATVHIASGDRILETSNFVTTVAKLSADAGGFFSSPGDGASLSVTPFVLITTTDDPTLSKDRIVFDPRFLRNFLGSAFSHSRSDAFDGIKLFEDRNLDNLRKNVPASSGLQTLIWMMTYAIHFKS